MIHRRDGELGVRAQIGYHTFPDSSLKAKEVMTTLTLKPGFDELARRGNCQPITVTVQTVAGLWNLIGKLVDIFQPTECANYFSSCGYDPD
jgi:hypothetical protein